RAHHHLHQLRHTARAKCEFLTKRRYRFVWRRPVSVIILIRAPQLGALLVRIFGSAGWLLYETTSGLLRSSRTSTTARRRWSTGCSSSRRSSATRRRRVSASSTVTTWSGSAALRFSPRTRRSRGAA